MALATIQSRAQVGISAPSVSVEVHLSRGLPSFSIVGLAETAVKESRDRVRSAILNSGFEFPNQRISVNLAPADLPKVGGRFDLPIAIGVLAASGQVPENTLKNKVFIGELALSGEMRAVSGSLTTALSLCGTDNQLVLPLKSANEASIVKGISVFPFNSLIELCGALNGLAEFKGWDNDVISLINNYPDISDINGQIVAKKALEIAASGNHSMIMIGSPGAGKTMLANRLCGIMPDLSDEKALETAAIASITDSKFEIESWRRRPFRTPHHSASAGALIGGGSIPQPGEITRAHNGILFLDELIEFQKYVLESMREPMESGYVDITRVSSHSRFPAKFLLIAAANPCKCGYFADPSGICRCTPEQVKKYLSKLSGPLLDRIDIQIKIDGVDRKDLTKDGPFGESSVDVRKRVTVTHQIQMDRQGKMNNDLDSKELKKFCYLTGNIKTYLDYVFAKLPISARGYFRVLKLARTIADIENSKEISKENISMAINLRHLDRVLLLNNV